MSGSDLRKFLTIMETHSSEATENVLAECMDESMKGWYLEATNEMVRRIKMGEYPIDVVNSLAREYCYSHGGTYETFAFARDALDRRAWEMGLRYTEEDNTTYTKVDQHDGEITPSVSEEEDDDMLMEELLVEFGIVDRFMAKIFPGTAAKIMGNRQFKKLTKSLRTNFLKQFGFGDGSKITYENALRFINGLNFDKQFIKDSIADFKKAGGSEGLMPDQPMEREDQVKLFATLAGNIMMEGGFDKIAPGKYRPAPGEETKTTQAKSDDKKDDASDERIDVKDIGLSPDDKFITIRTAEDALKLVKKASSGADLSREELHDVALGLMRVATDAKKRRR